MSDDAIEFELERAHNMHNFLINQIAGRCELHTRIALFIMFISIIQSHHAAIIILSRRERLRASAFALFRPLVETSLRGLYLALVANLDDVVQADNDQLTYPKINLLIELLDERLKTDGMFGEYSGSAWGVLCDYTHTGFEQLFRQVRHDGSIQPSYESNQVQELLKKTTAILVFVATRFLELSNRPDDLQRYRIIQHLLSPSEQK